MNRYTYTSFPSNFHRSQSLDLNPPQPNRAILMTHSSNALPAMSAPGSLQRRTAEGARHLRDSLTNVIREIEPIVETARNANLGVGVSNFLNRQQSVNNPPQNVANDENSSSFVINVEEVNSIDAQATVPARTTQNEVTVDNNNFTNVDQVSATAELQECITFVLKYLPFMLILLAKAVYDYHEAIFNLIILFVTFAHSNSTVRKEAVKRHKRSVSTLGTELLYILVCFVFIYYVFNNDIHDFNFVLHLVLIKTFTHPLTVLNLLWIVIVTDFMLKLITITVKILFTMLPGSMVDFKKRGKIYLFIEAISQLYRSIAAIQPCLYYLLESYQGAEKIIAVFLSAFYMISKGTDLMTKVLLMKNASLKLLQNVSIGCSPSKEQIQTAGEQCPICHDEYDSPVLLHCRHIFCEGCVTTWFDREQTCPLCRAKIVDDPSWRDGSTSYFMQLF